MTWSPPTPSTVSSTFSKFSYNSILFYKINSPTLFETSDSPPPPHTQYFQHICDKSSDPCCQNWYDSKSHTIINKCGTSTARNPPPENEQAPNLSQYKKNCKITLSSYLSTVTYFQLPLLLKNPYFFSPKQPCPQGTLGNPFNVSDSTIVLQWARLVPSKWWNLFAITFSI